jgi:hypothetical protein
LTSLGSSLRSLLRMDEHGHFVAPEQTLLGSSGQVYPDSMPERFAPDDGSGDDDDAGGGVAQPDGPSCHRDFGFASTGRWCFEDMLAQPEPRLFSTHSRAQNLPTSLQQGQGKLIVIGRNPKDAIVSAHFFHKKLASQAAGGDSAGLATGSMQSTCNAWNTGSGGDEGGQVEHGAYGDYYSWHREQVELLSLIGEDRATITFYETLKEDFDAEVQRLAAFLGLPLPKAKLDAVKKRVAFDAMNERG